MKRQTKTPAAANDPGRTGQPDNGNSSSAQRQRLLAYLSSADINTIEARRDLDILMPAARVFELRKQGYPIATIRTLAVTERGKRHSVARYTLRKVGLAGAVASAPVAA